MKGEDRKFPITLNNTDANISKVEFICKILGQSHALIQVMSKLFEVPVEEVINKYKIYLVESGK